MALAVACYRCFAGRPAWILQLHPKLPRDPKPKAQKLGFGFTDAGFRV